MSAHHLLVWLLIGLVAGAAAGRVVGTRGLGCISTTLVGLAGAVIGGLLLGLANAGRPFDFLGIIGDIVVAFIGAALLLGVLRVLVRRPRLR